MLQAKRRLKKKREYIIRQYTAKKQNELRTARVVKAQKERERREESGADGKPRVPLLVLLKNIAFTVSAVTIQRDTATIRIPATFDFTDNPNATINILRALYSVGMNKNIRHITFDHTQCEKIGICASTVMDVILLALLKERNRYRQRLDCKGYLSKNSKVNDILRVSGILYHLKIEANKMSPYVIKLDLIEMGKSKDVASKAVEYFEAIYLREGYPLSKRGLNRLGVMIGEIVENATHGGVDARWYTLGHYQISKGSDYGECLLVFFNFGKTIAQSMKNPDMIPDVRSALNRLIGKHTSWFKNDWNEENLLTLYALQDGVSRMRRKEVEPDRGTGTIKLIDNFLEIGQTYQGIKPSMSITSGKAHILFDGKYRLQRKQINDEIRQTIAFNTQNDLEYPPDPNYVNSLETAFPGTVISIRFYIDRKYLECIPCEKGGVFDGN